VTPVDEPERAGARRRFGIGAVVVLVIAALTATVLIGVLRGAASPVDDIVVDPSEGRVVAPSEGQVVAPSSAELYVHVAGAVTSPGLYVLPADARVVDAVAAAGGLADDADDAGINLARAVADGEQLYVPRVGEIPSGAQGAGAPSGADSGSGLVNLNTADAKLLDTLPRIGPAMAERIIAWRDDNGGFTSVEDLLAVPGIGDKMLESMRDLVTV
jgi:competence protein ComEA